MTTYLFKNTAARSYFDFIETESSVDNVKEVNLYWHKTKGLTSIVKLWNKDEFVFTFFNMNLQCSRKLKNKLFKKLCENNTNYKVQLKTH